MSYISLENISYQYTPQTEPVLRDLSLSVVRGDMLVISGPSGSGKTTLLQILGRLVTPTGGKVIFDPSLTDRQRDFGYAFIDGPFFEEMNAQDNILFLEQFADVSLDRSYYRYLIQYLQIDHLMDKKVSELSVGQRERVNIIRTLVHRPQVVILDEPGSNLDDALFEILLTLFREIQTKKDTTLCIATHDSRYRDMADIHYQMKTSL